MKMSEEPMRFKPLTRLGNWYERQVLEESNMKDYLDKKEKKQLISEKAHRCQSLSLSNPPSPHLAFNQHVLIQSTHNQAYLAIDSSKPSKAYELSATSHL
jgi:hypothetical protein